MVGLSKEKSKERMALLCKAYLSLKGKGTARQIFDWMNRNNFGISNDIGYYQVVDYLRNNVNNGFATGRGCLRDCYGYDKEGQRARVYYLKE